MNWLEKCDPRHSLDVTGWDQLYQALPQHEKHLNNLSNVKLLILKVCGLDIYETGSKTAILGIPWT